MASGQLGPVLGHIRRLIATRTAGDRTDQELLHDFAASRSEAAFTELVRRHGRLVLSVCGQVLRQVQDAEDACQATFLVLARKATTIRKGEALASWLYGVAFRIAMKARSEAAKRRAREHQPRSQPLSDPVSEAALRELQTFLLEEVHRLPEKQRAPFVLCCLEGKSRSEAAALLGWKEGTVAGRVALAREQLRRRLARRGVALSAALAAAALGTRAASASLPSALLAETTRAAISFTAGKAVTGADLSTRAVALAQMALKGMAMAKIKVSILFILISLFAAGTAALAWQEAGQKPLVAESLAQAAGESKPDKRDAVPTDLSGDPLPAEARIRLGTTRFRLGGLFYRCVYSPDGKVLAAGSGGHTVHLFDAATGRLIRELHGHQMDVICVAYSRDGRILASGSGDSTIAIWDPAMGKLVRKIYTEQQVIWSLAFSRDGKTLLSGGQDNSIRLWDLATGKELRKFEGHLDPVRSVAVSPDGRFAASASWDTTVRLWDLATGKLIREYTGHTPRKGADRSSEVYAVAFSPDGKLLASADQEPTVLLWDVASGKLVSRIPAPKEAASYRHGQVYTLAFSPDGKSVATGGSGYDLRLWDVATGKLRQQRSGKPSTTYSGWHSGGIQGIAFAPDGKTLAFGEENRLGLWDTHSGKQIFPSQGPAGNIRRVVFSADGKTLITASDDQSHRLVEWDLASSRLLRPLHSKLSWANLFAISPDRKILAATGNGPILSLWDTATAKEIRQIALPIQNLSQTLQAVAYSPDGRLIAGGGNFDDGSIRVWQAATGKEVHKLEGHGPLVWCLAFAPDSKVLASWGQDQELRLHDLTTGKKVLQFRGPVNWGHGLGFSPEGKLLVTVSSDWIVRLWDAASGAMVHQISPTPGSIDPYQPAPFPAFSPDGRMLATGGGDRIVRLWEVATGLERRAFHGHNGSIQALAFSPDGRSLASGSMDTTTLLWDVYAHRRHARPQRAPGTVQELDALWNDLASSDAARAFEALCTLLRQPGSCISLLKKHLHPLQPIDPQRLKQLLEDLNSNRFAVRQKATQELEKLGEAVEPALRKALANNTSLEVRQRVQKLLQNLQPKLPERLRDYRALELLERLGTAEAQQLLTDLAQGVPEARFTKEAQASSKRLAR